MEIRTEVINEMKQLSDEQESNFAKKLADNFTKWDEDRAAQITTAREIQEEVYLKQPARYKEKNEKWKSDVKLNGLHNIKKAIKSMLWREVYPNADAMFSVRGTNDQTEQMAKLQKASIVDSFNKMNIGKQYDLAVDSLLDIGEMIAKVDWVSKKKVVKRQVKGVGLVLQNIVSLANGAGFQQQMMQDVVIPVYENARVEAYRNIREPEVSCFDHRRR